MLNAFSEQTASEDLDQTLELLQELERNQPEELRKQRMHVRRQITAALVVRPANSSQRANWELDASTVDLSEGGCQIVSPNPCGVGDVYFLDFCEPGVELPKVFARCLRCRLIREDRFEVGFCFFTPIVLPNELLT